MSEATSYRFEAMGDRKSLQKALQRQQERIKYDDTMAERQAILKHEEDVNQKAVWNENLEEASHRRRLKDNIANMKAETKLHGKALVEVRRAALKRLLDGDLAMYEQELHAQGKTFYTKRT
ncbi:uncharacterized protein [Ptychodera flava]|uniref:uncharacterized protein n=1 Tax=Ptychodera flava TaxID=63121 RepID=UPI003969DB3C